MLNLVCLSQCCLAIQLLLQEVVEGQIAVPARPSDGAAPEPSRTVCLSLTLAFSIKKLLNSYIHEDQHVHLSTHL